MIKRVLLALFCALALPVQATPILAGLVRDMDGGGALDALIMTCSNDEIIKKVAGVAACAADETGSGSLGSGLASTTNDITASGSVIVFAGATESTTWTYTSNTLTVTSGTGVATIAFPGTVSAGSGFSGVGTALTALNGENIQDDTIDDDSLDFGTGADQISGADLTLTDAVAVTTTGKIISNANLDVKNGATTAGVLALFEDSDAGTDKATFQVPALAADTAYTLPADDGDNGQVLSTNGSGVMDWIDAGAGSGDVTAVGDCTTGACFEGSGAETELSSATDLILQVDADNDGTETLQVAAGDATVVAEFSEAGALQIDGALTVDGTGTSDFDGAVTGVSFTADDLTAEPGNAISVNDNDTAFSNDPTCANSGAAGTLSILDVDEGAGENWQICDGTSVLHDIVNTGSDVMADTQLLVGSGAGTGAFVTLSGEATLANTGAITLADSVTVASWSLGSPTITGTMAGANTIPSSLITTEVRSMYWGAAGMSADGTQCANPAEVTINSGPKLYTAICADNDGSTLYGSAMMPDGYDGGTVTFQLAYIQTAADTSAMNSDIAAQCRGNGEAPSSTWGSEVAIDDAAVVGSNSNDVAGSSAVTPAGTCAAGDMMYWRWQLDATGTTTAVATLHMVGMRMEFTSNVGD